MSTGKKVLNVFGIIFAWILSIVFVLGLIVSPIIMSALSVITPQSLSDAVTNIDISEVIVSEGLIEKVEESAGISSLLSSNAAKEVIELYATDITNVLSGDTTELKFTAEALQKIVEDNIDEIVTIAKENGIEVDGIPEEEIKETIKTQITDNIETVMEQIPTPQEITIQITEENPDLQIVFDIIGKAKTIKLSIAGGLVLISLLIFVCRLFGFRGFRWLSVDLFIASGFLILICVGLAVGSGMLTQLAADSIFISSAVGNIVSSFTTKVIIKSAVILVSAIALIIAYVFVKKAIAKKAAAVETPVAETETTETVGEITSAN